MPIAITTQTLHLPKFFFDYWRSPKLAEKKITQAGILELIRERKISFSKGAELLDIPLQDFFDLAYEHRIPYLDFEKKGELKQEVKALKNAFCKLKAQNK